MADSAGQLEEYKLQLQQVEATLTVDPDNEELKKLKGDLLEVILLTQDLINAQGVESDGGDSHGATATSSGAHAAASSSSHSWSVGDTCLAVYAQDDLLYPATIDELLPDGTCTVTYDGFSNTEVTQVSLLKPREDTSQLTGDGTSFKPKTKKDILIAQREYKRKKSQKKAQRMKQLEEERETEKNKWLDFNSKTFSKTNKGKVKRSIFATPDAVNGRVGVGTCGIGGRPMTSYTHQEKWTKK